MKWLSILVRVLEALANAINRKKKKDAADDPANTLANGGRVRKSNKSYSDLADESERDGTK